MRKIIITLNSETHSQKEIDYLAKHMLEYFEEVQLDEPTINRVKPNAYRLDVMLPASLKIDTSPQMTLEEWACAEG